MSDSDMKEIEKGMMMMGIPVEVCRAVTRGGIMNVDYAAGIKTLKGQIKHHVTEVYSPPRVTCMAERLGLVPGMAFDLTQVDPDDGKPWDFNDVRKRNKAYRYVARNKPLLLIGSPMCAAFSQLQAFNFAKMT